MISTNDLYQEIGAIEKALEKNITTDEAIKMQLKIGTLVLKLLHNQRTNMVQIMKKIGAQTIEPKEKKDEEKKQ
jgi:hypothetical protein